ncbi:Ribonuclease P protein subunit p30 [Coemansia sp. RSA 922]|nr:hypothetical protein GGI14_001599 [Coemansia sp. S680]KAJ2037680.1 hypothetical protein H4S03_002820 [Coemansia sp. S3946]KAJ2052268.1 hypothetical protein H4S04_001449 [Coemansia sp. S16]KAJ2101728.1 hypothetical protein GGI09_001607 [Coemansia sp. S100]KAJ2117618.1 Ribonuclease P protein subunit p30 [Coemansia sp. RSA 922]
MSVYNQFNYPSPSSSDVCASTPTFVHESHLSSLPAATSRIAGHANSSVYTYSQQADKLNRLPVHQLFTADGRLFIEYKPGHNLVYVDNQIEAGQPLQQVLQAACSGHSLLQTSRTIRKRRPKASRGAEGMPKKPYNAFIRYRCRHLQDTKQAHPAASQTELSRIIAEHWRSESPETKELFQAEYRDELSHYQASVKQFQAQYPFGA